MYDRYARDDRRNVCHSAEVWVRLTFKAQDGEIATAFRRLVSPPNGDAQLEEQIDNRLRAASLDVQ
ncbi:MAG: hypothetical protein Q8O70_03585 [Burkholderiales bacterium]|nr:hypothetical protein [Burkholderiales bacterium]